MQYRGRLFAFYALNECRMQRFTYVLLEKASPLKWNGPSSHFTFLFNSKSFRDFNHIVSNMRALMIGYDIELDSGLRMVNIVFSIILSLSSFCSSYPIVSSRFFFSASHILAKLE